MLKGNPVTGRGKTSASLFVDTSAWIALFSARDQYHKTADLLFRECLAAKRPLFTTNLVLAELHRLLLYRAGEKAAFAALSKIDSSASVHLLFPDSAAHKSAKAWIDQLAHLPISYTDAVSFAVMETLGCTEALSFDRHFQTAGFLVPPHACK